MAYGVVVVFVETPAFCRWRDEHLDDERFRALQNVLIVNPRIGDLIAGTGGLRKLRIGLPGRGKRGSARVIYYFWDEEERFYLLMAYAKATQADLSADQCRKLTAAMREDLENG